MQRGFKSKLEAGDVDAGRLIQVWTSVAGNAQYDIACFALNENDRVPDDRYVVFFNQTDSPNGEISLIDDGPNGATFQVNLVSLPPQIQKLCFTVTIDGSGSMRDIKSGAVRLMQNGQTAFSLEITGSHFQNQKAIVTIEIYNKSGGWRVAAVANGFNFSGGLDELMAHYGVDVSGGEETAPPRLEERSGAPTGNAVREQPQPPPLVDNGPGKNAEGFDRNDDDWV
jgi:stress response protein SCP2